MEQHDPFVVVYDLIPPFERHWQFVQHLRATPEFERRAFVYTNANGAAAHTLGGHNEPVIELHGLERDYEAVVNAVKLAATRSIEGFSA